MENVAGTKEGFREEELEGFEKMRKNLVQVRDGVGGSWDIKWRNEAE